MTLTPCGDVSAAAWIASSEVPWQQLVAFGPAGFQAYARLRFVPDPAYAGQPEAEIVVDDEAPSEHELLRAALEVLAQHTRTANDCYFSLWDGWGVDLGGPKVVVPHRAYFLLRGDLSEYDDWARSQMPDPAFIWPADRAWCIANDVDPHYAGIGASSAAIGQLVDHPGLDVVAADPRGEQPHYW